MPSLREVMLALTGNMPRVFHASSRNIAGALRPRFPESAPLNRKTRKPVRGLPIAKYGTDEDGETFEYDEFLLYQAGVITGLNGVIFGLVGMGKSALVKLFAYISIAFGYRVMIIDPKGEYHKLCKLIKSHKLVKIGAKSSIKFNPLDPMMDIPTRQELAGNMMVTLLNDRDVMTTEEEALLDTAVEETIKQHEAAGKMPTVHPLVEKLFNPTKTMAKVMRSDVESLRTIGREMALALQKLTVGRHSGTFDGPTTEGLLEDAQLLVFDCQDLSAEAAVLVATLINFFQTVWAKKYPHLRYHRVFHDEAWDLAVFPGYIRSLRRALKLGGSLGFSSWIVVHHEQNLERSSLEKAVLDLIADASTYVILGQSPEEIRASAKRLRLNRREVQRIDNLEPYQALWKIGNLLGQLVSFWPWPELEEMIQTRELVEGKEVTPA